MDVELAVLPDGEDLPATGRVAAVVVNLEELTYAAAVAGREGGWFLAVDVVETAREVVDETALVGLALVAAAEVERGMGRPGAPADFKVGLGLGASAARALRACTKGSSESSDVSDGEERRSISSS